ncbi:MAG TPA: hypothetical protein VLM38_15270 [Blastocatellia bacterium]|nr:hypothetical protein [Blastocatellia bacterium]
MELSLSGAGTNTISAGNPGAADSSISVRHSRLVAPIPPDKPVAQASIIIAQEVIRVFQAGQARNKLTTRLASAADCAYALSRWDVVGFVGDLLVGLSDTRESVIIGRYYQALSVNRGGQGDRVAATPLFQLVANEGPPRYRARALIALGNRVFTGKDPLGALAIYQEAIQILSRERSFDVVNFFVARKNMAVARALEGDHRGSLDDLEKLLPLARMAALLEPRLYYDYLNGLAVELGEEGRLDEAQRVSSIAVASPFASRFPAYRETFDEIAAKRRKASRSVVAVPSCFVLTPNSPRLAEKKRVASSQTPPTNILLLRAPEREAAAEAKMQSQTKTTARVINFQQWKAQTMTPAHLLPGRLTPEQRAVMTTGEKLIRLMDLISRDETDDEMIDRILDSVEAIVLNRADEKRID